MLPHAYVSLVPFVCSGVKVIDHYPVAVASL